MAAGSTNIPCRSLKQALLVAEVMGTSRREVITPLGPTLWLALAPLGFINHGSTSSTTGVPWAFPSLRHLSLMNIKIVLQCGESTVTSAFKVPHGCLGKEILHSWYPARFLACKFTLESY